MKYKIDFQPKTKSSPRPDDISQDDEYIFESGQFAPIPAVGDSVTLKYGGELESFKVLTRHFSYLRSPSEGDMCLLNIVIEKLSAAEMAARLKE